MSFFTLKKESYFLSQPHQPFFLAGVVWAMVVMLLFALSYHGLFVLNVESTFFHAYSMIFMVFTPFFNGFIFTTFPRFCQSEVIAKRRYLQVLFTSQLGSLFFVIGLFVNIYLTLFGIFLLFISHIMSVVQLQKTYSSGYGSKNSSDPFWILIGFYVGVFVHLLFFVTSIFGLFDIKTGYFFALGALGVWNYLIFVAFAVAQRMVPFFSHVMQEKISGFSATVFTGLLLKTLFIVMVMQRSEMLLDIALGIYIALEYRRWKLQTFNSPAILWVLHLALYWIPLALFLGALSKFMSIYVDITLNFFQLHVMVIGFLTTVLIGFGTRVTLGHSGQAPHADRYTTNLFLFVQVIVVIRAFYAFFTQALWLFDLAAFAWIVLYLFWSGRFALVLIHGKKIS